MPLSLEVRWVSRAETIENHVLSQRPNPGQKLSPKSVIEAVVNRYVARAPTRTHDTDTLVEWDRPSLQARSSHHPIG
jgi:beta-lactam-binding protein with PASTA domain